MKIAYWSNSRDSGVTGSMLAIAMAGVLIYPSLQITMFENHFNTQGISQRLFPKHMLRRIAEESVYCGRRNAADIQIPCFSQKINGFGDYYNIEVVEHSLFYVRQPNENPELFDYEFHCGVMPLLSGYSGEDKIAFIDTRRGNSISSKIILEDADVIAVVLRQSMREIQDFIQNYSSLLPKTFFIIGNYVPNMNCNLREICRQFGFMRERIGVIPHSDEYEHAMMNGRTKEYLLSNFVGAKTKKEHNFMQELKKTTFLLFQRSVFPCRRENSSEPYE